MTSQLFETSAIDVRDSDDDRMERANTLVENMTRELGDVDATEAITNYASRGQANHDEVQLGLLYAVLTGTSATKHRERAYRNMLLTSRDGLNVIGDRVLALVRDKWHKLLEKPRSSVVWLAREFVEKQVSPSAKPDALCYALLKQIIGGDVSTKNMILIEGLMELFARNRPWLDSQPVLVASVVYAYIRIIPEHNASTSFQQREVAFIASLLRERFADCMQIGRDLVRALLDVIRFREFETIWRDLLTNPQSLAPQLENMSTLLRRKSSKKILANRVCGEIESKVLFTLTQVRHVSSRRHFDWLAKACFTTESLRTFRADLIRYVCCTFHPSNDLLQSDIVPRWSLITMILVATLNDRAAFHSCALALFWDWLFMEDPRDIMLVEPGILVVQRAYRQPAPHNAVAFRCFETLLRVVKDFVPEGDPPAAAAAAATAAAAQANLASLKDLSCLNMHEAVRHSVNYAMKIVVDKSVIPPGSAAALLHTVSAGGLFALREVFSTEFFGLVAPAAASASPAASPDEAPLGSFSPPHESGDDDVVMMATERDQNKEVISIEDESPPSKKTTSAKKPDQTANTAKAREKENKAATSTPTPTPPTQTPASPPTTATQNSGVTSKQRRESDKKPTPVATGVKADTAEVEKKPLSGLHQLAIQAIGNASAAGAKEDRERNKRVSNNGEFASLAVINETISRGSVESLQRELAQIGSDFVERRRRRSSDTHALPGELVELADEILLNGERTGDAELRRAFETLRSTAEKQRDVSTEDRTNDAKLCEAIETALQTLVDDAEFIDAENPSADELVTKLARFLSATLNPYFSEATNSHSKMEITDDDSLVQLQRPAFALFHVLMDLVYNKSSANSSESERHKVAVRNRLFALFSRMQFACGCDQLGYLLLFFLRATTQRIDERCTAYRDYADYLMANMTRIRSNNSSSSTSLASPFGVSRRPTSLADVLLNDLRCCARDDVALLTALSIYSYNVFEKELLGNIDVIHTVLSTIDYSHLQELLNAIAQDSLLLFQDEHVVPIVQRSLEWESIEQSFLWDLLLLHQFDPSAYTPLLTRLSYSKNPEALAKMLHAFVDREPDVAMLCALLNRCNTLQSNWTRLGNNSNTAGGSNSRICVDAFTVSVLASWCQKEVVQKRRSEVGRPKPQSAVAKPLRKLVDLCVASTGSRERDSVTGSLTSTTANTSNANSNSSTAARPSISRELLRLRDKLKEQGVAVPSLEVVLSNFDALRRQLKDCSFLEREEIAAPLRDLVQRHPLVSLSSAIRNRFSDLLAILDTSESEEDVINSSPHRDRERDRDRDRERDRDRDRERDSGAHGDAAQRSLRDVPSRKAAAAEKQQDERNRPVSGSSSRGPSSTKGSHDRRPNRTGRRRASSSSSSSGEDDEDVPSDDEKDDDYLHGNEPNEDEDEEYHPSNAKRQKRNWNAE